jgi:hypothetical protein
MANGNEPGNKRSVFTPKSLELRGTKHATVEKKQAAWEEKISEGF